MGNACFGPPSAAVKLILHGGGTRLLAGGKHLAGEIMFEFPEHMVCHGGSFYIGHPIPSLSISDELLPGETYFLIPLDSVTHNVLSTSSVAALARPGTPVKFNHCPFEYLKGADGRVLIKVTPDFIERLIAGGESNADADAEAGAGAGGGYLCSTPELQKHYTQLVGPRDQLWSPKLETISEHKIRFSPCRFIGLEWKQKEVET